MQRTLLGGLVILLALGCRTQPMPVRLQGDPVSIAWLAGAWTGEYRGTAGRRGGSLAFILRSGTDSLYGDVTMVGPTGQPLRPADPIEVHRAHVQIAQQLRIDVVVAHEDVIMGTLEPYISPDCECVVETTFMGQVRGNVITGTFATRSGGLIITEGEWEMRRQGYAAP